MPAGVGDDPDARICDSHGAVTPPLERRWRVAPRQYLLFEDFDDGIVMFDSLVGSTHFLNATAAEALAVVEETPGLDAAAIQRRVIDRLALKDEELPLPSVVSLLQRFESMNLLSCEPS
jgi:PqqD family protein of HPr-rel-A system